MRIRQILESISPNADFEYRGDPDARFRGVSLRPNGAGPRRRFFVLVDDSWSAKNRRQYRPAGLSDEEAIQSALDEGAAGIVCSAAHRWLPALEGREVFFTDSTRIFAFQLVAAVRSRLRRARITAVTGSAGKSTTKAMLVHALRATGVDRVQSAPGNRNLDHQVLSQLSRSPRYSHSVLEVAGSAFPRFDRDGFSVSPDVSVVTSISEAHLDYLHDLKSIAQIKSGIFSDPPPGGTAVINLDVPHAEVLTDRAVKEGCQVITYGESERAGIRLIHYNAATQRSIVDVGQRRVEYKLGAPGKHLAMNSLAVIATLRAHRIQNWREGLYTLENFRALEGRGAVSQVKLESGAVVRLIDEAYNANPDSIRASLDTLIGLFLDKGVRRVAVLGDILELANQGERVHRGLADAVLRSEIDEVHLFGEYMSALDQEIRHHRSGVHYWPDLKSMANALLGTLRNGDVVLVKASGSTGLKDFVRDLVRTNMVPDLERTHEGLID